MNYVISLKNADERRLHILNEFKKHNLNFIFFDAVTVDEIEYYSKKFNISFDDKLLTKVEKACFLSHIAILDNFLKSDSDYVSVFEDDVILGENSNYFLSNYDWVPDNIDFIKLEKFEHYAFMGIKKVNIGYSRFLRILKGKHLGAAGYILSREGAKSILNNVCNKFINRPIDVIIFEDKILSKEFEVVQMTPGIVIQAGRQYCGVLPSQLEGERSKKKIKLSKNKLSFKVKLKRELFRVIKNIWKIFCKINFK